MHRVVTKDETWVYQFDPKAKKKDMYAMKAPWSAGKVMVTFWDSQGVIMVEYLEEECMINGTYYAEVLRLLCQEIVKKRRGKLIRCSALAR